MENTPYYFVLKMRPASASRHGRAASANNSRNVSGLGNPDSIRTLSPSPDSTIGQTSHISPDDDDAYAKALERAMNRGASARIKQKMESRDAQLARRLAAGLTDDEDLEDASEITEASEINEKDLLNQIHDPSDRPLTARTKQQIEDDGKESTFFAT